MVEIAPRPPCSGLVQWLECIIILSLSLDTHVQGVSLQPCCCVKTGHNVHLPVTVLMLLLHCLTTRPSLTHFHHDCVSLHC